jgi:hypothetical protein
MGFLRRRSDEPGGERFLMSYGVDVATGEDVPLILAITVAIDALTTGD